MGEFIAAHGIAVVFEEFLRFQLYANKALFIRRNTLAGADSL